MRSRRARRRDDLLHCDVYDLVHYGVATANWHHSSNLRSLLAVVKTPAVIAVVPALLFNAFGLHPPLVIERPAGLLAGAMVPVMLLALGVQLADTGIPRMNGDMLGASLVRLLAGPPSPR